jgi:hypothetical protein
MFAPQAPVPLNTNNADVGNEAQRRQQIMRLGLIICFIFLLLDNGSQSGTQGKNGTKSTEDPFSEIPLSAAFTTRVNTLLEQKAVLRSKPFNATGMYRGEWSTMFSEAQPQTGDSQDHNSADHPALARYYSHSQAPFLLFPPYFIEFSPPFYVESETHDNFWLQLVAVPVRGMPDLSFVYGVLRMYHGLSAAGAGAGGHATTTPSSSTVAIMPAMSFPLQGQHILMCSIVK